MRQFAALTTCVGLVLGLLIAPFTHVHAAGHHEGRPEHQAAFVHSHFSPHASHHSGKTSVSDNDDDEDGVTQLNLFNFSTVTPISVPDLPASGFTFAEEHTEFSRVLAPLVCAHDPPSERSPGLRAPPV